MAFTVASPPPLGELPPVQADRFLTVRIAKSLTTKNGVGQK